VLYGMIGLLGAKIWKENNVEFGRPVNLVPIGAGIILAIGDAQLKFTPNFSLTGIALGTLVVVGFYHLANLVAPKDIDDGTMMAVGRTGIHHEEGATPEPGDGSHRA
jgi:xanthine/uracil permease